MILLISSVSDIKIDCFIIHLTPDQKFCLFHDVSKNAQIFSFVTA